jgi:hypothetical protein
LHSGYFINFGLHFAYDIFAWEDFRTSALIPCISLYMDSFGSYYKILFFLGNWKSGWNREISFSSYYGDAWTLVERESEELLVVPRTRNVGYGLVADSLGSVEALL